MANKWGGKREGAGRKPAAVDGTTRKMRSIRASDMEWKYIHAYASLLKDKTDSDIESFGRDLININRLTKFYEDSLERAKGYITDEKIYRIHLAYCLQFATLLGIQESAVFKELQQEVDTIKEHMKLMRGE